MEITEEESKRAGFSHLFLGIELDVELLKQLCGFLFLEVHDGIKHLVDWIKDELAEAPGVPFSSSFVPFLPVEELIPPKPLHQFDGFNLELFRINLCKLLKCEGPSMQA